MAYEKKSFNTKPGMFMQCSRGDHSLGVSASFLAGAGSDQSLQSRKVHIERLVGRRSGGLLTQADSAT